MQIERLLEQIGADFYTGVPDSQLKALCDYLMDTYGTDPRHHVIGANEGNCAALAAGYHLATGRVPVVYLQNSGLGHIINPLASLLHEQVYGIPCLFFVGWRGEPGVPDEPQHRFQGEVTLGLLKEMGVETFVIGRETGEAQIAAALRTFRSLWGQGRQTAFLIRKNALQFSGEMTYRNRHAMRREEIIRRIAAAAGRDPVIATTGKTSRELFEIRERAGEGHGQDFLTVGSMGHSSSIALGIALQRPERRIWLIDGDGAALMHLGAMAVIGAAAPENLVHIVINNEAHESVGGMPTAAGRADLTQIARGCGYPVAACADSLAALEEELKKARERRSLAFLEVKCAIGSRPDLGRPGTAPRENREAFARTLRGQARLAPVA